MSKILSQDEIDALLASSVSSNGGRESPAADRNSPGDAVSYNFRRPDRISKEQLRSLHFLHDRFALNVSTSLSAFLRSMTEVNIVSVEQFAYSEFLMSLPDPTAFYAVGMSLFDGVGALEMNPSVAFTMIDRLLGGTGQTPGPNRALTEIEQNVVDSVVKLMLDNLTETWKPVANMEFRIQGRETRPQMLQVTGATEIVILLVFDIRIADTRGMVNLCIPAAAIEAVGEAFAQGWQRARRQPTADEETWLHANLGRVSLPVTALLETTLPARDLIALRPGDVLSLGHAATLPIDVHVGTVRRFGGRLTRVGSGTGVLVESMVGSAASLEGAA
ncbi:MAG TPA: flagellar motor switch protein FliM [Vicinamibacterales bacterium]|nr:flagellar motor switch protein FliM [Vicinamibacterales bacterium]